MRILASSMNCPLQRLAFTNSPLAEFCFCHRHLRNPELIVSEKASEDQDNVETFMTGSQNASAWGLVEIKLAT
ncbi:hypothetical protein D5086_004284 [Populus alba]|uniref:Uncharacterized protein n=1 Tax=Populus alba TaxID=43335 RepID=A0ACC4CR65_POPAL